jgi:hypothetical protein
VQEGLLALFERSSGRFEVDEAEPRKQRFPPNELFSRCEASAARLLEGLEKINEVSVELVTFRPLFKVDLDLEEPLQPADPEELNTKKLHCGRDRYFLLLQRLREAANDDDLWQVLARWLNGNGIRKPNEVVPPATYRRLIKRDRLDRDFRYYRWIEEWRPYFQQLLADRGEIKQNNAFGVLLKAGYEEKPS